MPAVNDRILVAKPEMLFGYVSDFVPGSQSVRGEWKGDEHTLRYHAVGYEKDLISLLRAHNSTFSH